MKDFTDFTNNYFRKHGESLGKEIAYKLSARISDELKLNEKARSGDVMGIINAYITAESATSVESVFMILELYHNWINEQNTEGGI